MSIRRPGVRSIRSTNPPVRHHRAASDSSPPRSRRRPEGGLGDTAPAAGSMPRRTDTVAREVARKALWSGRARTAFSRNAARADLCLGPASA
jgi:hypothetical protein